MTLTADRVRSVFSGLEGRDPDRFFEHVASDVDWTVLGTHPLAGRHRDKAEFRRRTFGRLGKLVKDGVRLSVEHVLVDGNWATVELRSHAMAKNGAPFDNRYCWVIRFQDEVIVEVRAYLDSALVQRIVDENEIHPAPLPPAEG